MRTFLVMSALLFLQACASDGGDGSTEEEPNDEPATATRIGTSGVISGGCGPEDENDFFVYELDAIQEVEVSIDATLEWEIPGTVLLEAQCNPSCSGPFTSDVATSPDESVELETAAAIPLKTLWLRVWCAEGSEARYSGAIAVEYP